MKATSCALCGAPRDMSLKGARCRRCHDEYFSRLRANRRQALKANDPAEYARQQQVNRDRTRRSRERRAAEMFQRLVRS